MPAAPGRVKACLVDVYDTILASRFNERQADRYAFRSIRSVQPFIRAMNKLASQNLAERTPSRWVEWFFHSHPAISRRVAAAEAWKLQLATDSRR